MAKYNTLKGNLALLFELQRIQAEALYELQGNKKKKRETTKQQKEQKEKKEK